MDFHRHLRALGVGPCVPWSLPWKDERWANGVGSIPTGSWAYRTVRFYKVLLQSPSNLHLAPFFSISPSLVQVFLQKWSHRVPQDQQLQISGWMAAVLCFQDSCFPSVVNPPPWLVWISQMLSCEVLLGSEASWNHILVTLELECWVWASALAAEQAGGGCRRSKRSWELFCYRKYRTAVQSLQFLQEMSELKCLSLAVLILSSFSLSPFSWKSQEGRTFQDRLICQHLKVKILI